MSVGTHIKLVWGAFFILAITSLLSINLSLAIPEVFTFTKLLYSIILPISLILIFLWVNFFDFRYLKDAEFAELKAKKQKTLKERLVYYIEESCDKIIWGVLFILAIITLFSINLSLVIPDVFSLSKLLYTLILPASLLLLFLLVDFLDFSYFKKGRGEKEKNPGIEDRTVSGIIAYLLSSWKFWILFLPFYVLVLTVFLGKSVIFMLPMLGLGIAYAAEQLLRFEVSSLLRGFSTLSFWPLVFVLFAAIFSKRLDKKQTIVVGSIILLLLLASLYGFTGESIYALM